jgi:hypothetical protein
MADTLGLKDVSAVLTKNLNEEMQAAKKIVAAAKPIWPFFSSSHRRYALDENRADRYGSRALWRMPRG